MALLVLATATLAARPAGAEAPAASSAVAGVSRLRDLEAWFSARRAEAERRVADLDRAEQALATDAALAATRLAEALQGNAALLAARRSLDADAARAGADRAAAEADARRLGAPVARGLLALAARGRPETAPARGVARLRAVVGGLLEPYAASVRRGRELAGDAARLGGAARGLDARLGPAGAELARLDGGLRAARAGLLAARRERALALARRDALARHLGELAARGRAAAEGPHLAAAPGSPGRPPGAAAEAGLLAALSTAASPPPRPLLASARAAPPRPSPAGGARRLAFGPATTGPAVPAGGLFAPIAGARADAGGDALFRGGVLLEAAVGQTVSAPCAGRVAFADRFKGFGLLLIIDRGDGYHALLSGFSRLDVGRGARVAAGQAVGAVGPGREAARLYVELRRGGSPVDPSLWLTLREDKVRS